MNKSNQQTCLNVSNINVSFYNVSLKFIIPSHTVWENGQQWWLHRLSKQQAGQHDVIPYQQHFDDQEQTSDSKHASLVM